MKTSDVIRALKCRGVELWREGNALRYRAPAGALTDREKTTLKAHKAALLKALAAGLDNSTITASAPVASSTTVTVPPVRECRNCANFEPYPYEPLGSCHVFGRMQHTTSKPKRFGCSHFQPVAGGQVRS